MCKLSPGKSKLTLSKFKVTKVWGVHKLTSGLCNFFRVGIS